MSAFHKLESKFSRWSIPHLIKILAIFQLIVWVMTLIQPDFLAYLILQRDAVFSGQVWRLVTWVFYIGNIHWLFVIFYAMFVFAMSDVLEEVWGTFKVNLFIFGGMLAVIAQELLLPKSNLEINLLYGAWLNTATVMAFASVAPNFQILLFFVIPVKMKWLAIFSGAMLFIQAVTLPGAFLPVLSCCINFLIAFFPNYIREQRGQQVSRERMAKFQEAKQELDFFHQCHQCGKTEHDDKHLEFRVTADGEEYCSECRPPVKSA